MLSQLEAKVLRECCDLNENITIFYQDEGKHTEYKTRFLKLDAKNKVIVIDRPSSGDSKSKTLVRGDRFQAFFTFKSFRYLFDSVVGQLTKFKIGENVITGLRILLPDQLLDGDKREYFRVQTGMRPPVLVKFNRFVKGAEEPVMSAIMEKTPEEYRAEMVDISGGGFSMRTKIGDAILPLEKEDVINAQFKLKPDVAEMEIWCVVRNRRRYKDSELVIFGLQFLEGDERNRLLKHYRNQIMRYVVERQREMLK